jgi:uncharacterized membrane protein YedE/YeeE
MSTTPFTNTENIVLNDLEKRELDAMCVNESKLEHQWYHNIKYILVGIVFGIIFVKAEIVSWFRIQEMFRLQSFHMYGIIGSAIAVAMLSIFLIRRYKVRSIYGEEIVIQKKTFNKGVIYGGLIFGIGWALTGACPGPLFAQVGTGVSVVLVTVLSALLGTWVYGYFRKSLPH